MLTSQYGIATSSSAIPVSHAEDAQPNETIYKRRHGLPPQIGSSHRDSGIQRGSYGGPWTQYAIRGNGSRRGRGNFQSNRGGGHAHRSTHHSVPPITTLPDIEYPTSSSHSSSSSSPSSRFKTSHQPSMSDSQNHLPQTGSRYRVPPDDVHVPSFSPTFSEPQLVDDHHWLHRSRSPSPKLPPSALKRRKIERQSIHVSNSGRIEDLFTSQSINYHSPPPGPINKPLLPGRHRRIDSSVTIPPLYSPEPLVQVQTEAASPARPNDLEETSLIKEEPRTPSPARSRSLITSSCKFYPIPEFCKKSQPGFKERRKAYSNEKMQELSRLGLKGIKSFFRDDGLVIEWESKVPVWSDTLLPEFPDLASAIKRAALMNYQTPAKSGLKRKRQSVDQPSRESSLKNNNTANIKASQLNEPNRPHHSLENTSIQPWADEIEIIEPPIIPFRSSSSPTPMSSLDHGNRSSTTDIPFPNTSELICLDPEVAPCSPYGAESPNTPPSVIQQQKTTAMDVVDTPTPTQPPKPPRRMLFKPVHPLRRNQPTTSYVQDSTLPTSDSDRTISTSLSAAEGHSKKDQIQVESRQDDVPPQEKTSLPRAHPPLPSPWRRHSPHGPARSHTLPTATQTTSTQGTSKSCTPTAPPLRTQVAEEVEVQETRASLSKDVQDYANAADTDAELVVNCGTPEEPNNRLSNSRQEEIVEDLPLRAGYENENYEDDKDDGPSSVEEDMAAVEVLATQFLQRYLPLFDVDRLKLEAAYAKNAFFSCRVHHIQEPSFSMAGLFAPESSGSRRGFNVSRSRASISAIQKGRSQIVDRLLELGPHSFCPRGVPRTVNYDVVPLSSATGGGILLTVHGEVVNPHLAGPEMDHVLSVDQSFVLRKRGLEDEDEDEGMDGFGQTAASNLWPLVAVSHQMTVRDAKSLPLELLDGLVSQIQGS